GRECLAEVAVVRVFGGDYHALPFGEPVGECAAFGCQVLDPLACLGDLFTRCQGEFFALGLGCWLGFGRPEWFEPLAGVAAAQFGVGGHGQVPLLGGGPVPFGPVVHDGGEYVLALAVGVVHGAVA